MRRPIISVRPMILCIKTKVLYQAFNCLSLCAFSSEQSRSLSISTFTRLRIGSPSSARRGPRHRSDSEGCLELAEWFHRDGVTQKSDPS